MRGYTKPEIITAPGLITHRNCKDSVFGVSHFERFQVIVHWQTTVRHITVCVFPINRQVKITQTEIMTCANTDFVPNHIIPFQNGIYTRFKFKIRKTTRISRINRRCRFCFGWHCNTVCCHCAGKCRHGRRTRNLVRICTWPDDLFIAGFTNIFGVALVRIATIWHLICGRRGLGLIVRGNALVRGKRNEWRKNQW